MSIELGNEQENENQIQIDRQNSNLIGAQDEEEEKMQISRQPSL